MAVQQSVPLVSRPGCPDDALGGASARPSNKAAFAALLRKHFLIARARRRFTTAVYPVIIYVGIIVAMYIELGPLSEEALAVIVQVVPIFLTTAISPMLTTAMSEIMTEKESGMKAIQEIYGIGPVLYFASWGVYYLCVACVCTAVILAMLGFANAIHYSSICLVCMIFLVTYMQQFILALFASVFFDRLRTALVVTSLISTALLIFAITHQAYAGNRTLGDLWMNLLPTVNIVGSMHSMLVAENYFHCDPAGRCTRGLTFRSLWSGEFCEEIYSKASPCPHLFENVSGPIYFLFLDVFLFSVVTWYAGNVWQGKYGVAKPWNFCLSTSWLMSWRPSRARTVRRGPIAEGLLEPSSTTDLALSISGLRKVFAGKVAVDNITLEVATGEIFALLGHNGAGKTTTINCVVGLMPTTAGEIEVNGCNIKHDLELARRQMSVCPQDSPFYDKYTVRQHLVFFASLRGITAERVDGRMGEVLQALGMPEKVDDLCDTLSGGQMRRLWVATALLGESPLVFLDEPTSGMDPSSRRALWDLLLAMRTGGRSILFTTHYLEEADLLADRKAIMARGVTQAVGTSRDLKRHFSIGYHLCIELSRDAPADRLSRIDALVKEHVPSATLDVADAETVMQAADAPEVVAYRLPYDQADSFASLLLALDGLKDVGLQRYNVMASSLEEVFMRLGAQAEEGQPGGAANTDFREVTQAADFDVAPREVPGERQRYAQLLVTLLTARKNKWGSIIIPTFFFFLALSRASDDAGGFAGVISNAIQTSSAFSVSMVSFSIALVTDRISKCRQVSLAQGLSIKAYWLGSCMSHYLCTFSLSLVYIGGLMARRPLALWGNGFLLVFIHAFVYPAQLIFYMYNTSLMFKSVEMAGKVVGVLNLLLGILPTFLVFVLWSIEDAPGHDWAKPTGQAVHVVMSIVNPIYAFPGTLLGVGYMQTEECGERCELADLIFSRAIVPLILSPVSLALYAGNLWFQESRSYAAVPGPVCQSTRCLKDADVLAEEARLAQAPEDDGDAVVLRDLHHTYRTKVGRKWVENVAVRGISLGIRRGECFGLLGPNGAGKTTTLGVLTGEVRPPTAGRVSIFGHDMLSGSGRQTAFKMLGFCPQVNPLWPTLSGRNHLMYYGRIKGVPEAELTQEVDALLWRLGLAGADADKMTGIYSGGMKRKLSLGIALIGKSPLLFLDEPSAAVDAAAKRHLWKVLKMRARSQTVVLTTHSLEEAEALCDRIAIQVKGQLRCLGTPRHIRTTYTSGYHLEVWYEARGVEIEEHKNAMLTFLQDNLRSEVALAEHHPGRYVFNLPGIGFGDGMLSLGQVFSVLQGNLSHLGILDYSLGQPTLEQVFLSLAREQDELDEPTEAAANTPP